jgi:hypothetical protein
MLALHIIREVVLEWFSSADETVVLLQLVQGFIRFTLAQGPHLVSEFPILAHLPIRIDAEIGALGPIPLARLVHLRVIILLDGILQRLGAFPSLMRNDGALVRVKLPEEPGHQRIRLGVILALFDSFLDLLLGLLFTLAQGVLQEVLGASLLCGLLLQNVIEQIPVPLDQPRRVLLPMVHLLLTVPLNPTKQGLQLVLLPLTKDCLLLGQLDAQLLLHVVHLLLLQGLAD